jgi:hypothetical protein
MLKAIVNLFNTQMIVMVQSVSVKLDTELTLTRRAAKKVLTCKRFSRTRNLNQRFTINLQKVRISSPNMIEERIPYFTVFLSITVYRYLFYLKKNHLWH